MCMIDDVYGWFISHLNVQFKCEYKSKDNTPITKISYPLSTRLEILANLTSYVNQCYMACKTLTKIHSIPFYVQKLICMGPSITQLPEHLPYMLQDLQCTSTSITRLLAHLPYGLTELTCSYNNLMALPDILPDSIVYIDCIGNKLTHLPNKLPRVLKKLYCMSNVLTALPVLPPGLEVLICHSNPIRELPVLPQTLHTLGCDSCVLLNYLPDLPYTLKDIQIAHSPELKKNYPLLLICVDKIGLSYDTCVAYKYPAGTLGGIMYVNECNSRRRTQARTRLLAQELAEVYLRRALHPRNLAPLLDDPDADPQDFMDALGERI